MAKSWSPSRTWPSAATAGFASGPIEPSASMADLRTPASASPSALASRRHRLRGVGSDLAEGEGGRLADVGIGIRGQHVAQRLRGGLGLLAHAAQRVGRGVADVSCSSPQRLGQLGHRGLGVGPHVAEREDGGTADPGWGP